MSRGPRLGTLLFETDEEEQERLTAAPKDSTLERCSRLPVLNPYPTEGQVLLLPQLYAEGEFPGQVVGWIVVCLVNTRPVLPARFNREGRRLRDASWTAMVVASRHPSYGAGTRIVVSETELRRARRVQPADLLSLFDTGRHTP